MAGANWSLSSDFQQLMLQVRNVVKGPCEFS